MANTAPSRTPRSVILRRVRLRAVWYCAKSDSVQYHTARSHDFRKYLCESEFCSKTFLDCLSGTQMGSIHEKNLQKSRDTASLKAYNNNQIFYV